MVGIDATTLEANAALRSIVRRDTGESYQDFLTKLAQGLGHRDADAGGFGADRIESEGRRARMTIGPIRTIPTHGSRR